VGQSVGHTGRRRRPPLPLVVALLLAIAAVIVVGIPDSSPRHGTAPSASPPGAEADARTPTCVNAPRGWALAEAADVASATLPTGRVKVTPGTVNGYLDSSWTACGQPDDLHLLTHQSTTVVIEAIHLGWYRHGDARVVWQSAAISLRAGPPDPQPGSHLTVALAWPDQLSVRPDPRWPPGLYLLRIDDIGHPGHPGYVPLVVRTSGVHAAYDVVASDLTQLAYNEYGGRSLYSGHGRTYLDRVANRAYTASARRPLEGSGLQQLFTMQVSLALFLDRHRLVADWTTDSALDAQPGQLAGYAAVVLPGHSEYWTRRMYDALTSAVDAGTNLAVLGGNEIYWQARLGRSASGDLTTMTVYRDAQLDPVRNRSLTTVRWARVPLGRDEARLTGEGMSAINVSGPFKVLLLPGWARPTPDLHVGLLLPGAVSGEGDAVEGPGHNSPPNTEILLGGLVRPPFVARAMFMSASYYARRSGAGIFDAGVTQWLCTIELDCFSSQPVPRVTRNALSQLTADVLAAFARPRAGSIYPPHAVPWVDPLAISDGLPIGAASTGPDTS
jgi:hypothetical protein